MIINEKLELAPLQSLPTFTTFSSRCVFRVHRKTSITGRDESAAQNLFFVLLRVHFSSFILKGTSSTKGLKITSSLITVKKIFFFLMQFRGKISSESSGIFRFIDSFICCCLEGGGE
jgi:hypothetical protein